MKIDQNYLTDFIDNKCNKEDRWLQISATKLQVNYSSKIKKSNVNQFK